MCDQNQQSTFLFKQKVYYYNQTFWFVDKKIKFVNILFWHIFYSWWLHNKKFSVSVVSVKLTLVKLEDLLFNRNKRTQTHETKPKIISSTVDETSTMQHDNTKLLGGVQF